MSIPPDDRGLLLGDGLFETVLAVRGRLVMMDAHLARLGRGCAVLGLPQPDPPALTRAARQAVAAAGLADQRAAVRLTWSAGSGGRGLDRPEAPVPRLIVSAAAAPALSGPVSMATVSVRRNPTSPTARLKSLAYLDNVVARQQARAVRCDEALMLNTAGELASAAAANLFWIRNGTLFTPALDCGVLDGIQRAAVLVRAEGLGLAVREVRATPDALDGAEAVFITNSLIGVRAVSAVDGAPTPWCAAAEALAADALPDRL